MECYTFLYTRRSSEEDDRQALSLAAQGSACREYAERHSIEITEVIQESHSARHPGRPLFEAMLARITDLMGQGQRVRVLCHKPDRLLRNYGDWSRINSLWEAGIQLEFVTGSFANNAQGRMAMGMNVVFAKYYVDNLSEEVKKGLNEKLARGEWPGWAPLGYRNVREKHAAARIVPDPVVAPLIQRAFEEFATGEYSLAGLSRKLYREGLAGRLRGNPLTKSILRDRILTNPFYCGLMRYRGGVHHGSHEPLISQALFERVQAVLHSQSRPRRQRHSFRYSGLFQCRGCGCAVVADRKKERYVYYRCSHRRGDCREGYVREEALETMLQHRLAETLILTAGHLIELRRAAAQLAGELDKEDEGKHTLERRLRELETRLGALLDLRLGGHLTDDEYTSKRNELVRAQAGAQQELAAFELPQEDPKVALDWFIRTCERLPEILRDGTDGEIRALLRILCSNYRLGGGRIDFEPVKPFDLAARVRNRPNWRAEPNDILTLVNEVRSIKLATQSQYIDDCVET